MTRPLQIGVCTLQSIIDFDYQFAESAMNASGSEVCNGRLWAAGSRARRKSTSHSWRKHLNSGKHLGKLLLPVVCYSIVLVMFLIMGWRIMHAIIYDKHVSFFDHDCFIDIVSQMGSVMCTTCVFPTVPKQMIFDVVFFWSNVRCLMSVTCTLTVLIKETRTIGRQKVSMRLLTGAIDPLK